MTTLAVAGLAALLAAGPAAPAGDGEPAVLVLHSYHRGFTWTDQETEGILAGLRERWPRIEPWVEHLDRKRFPPELHDEAFLGLLREKYGAARLDAVIVTDDAALEFALRHRALLGEAPVAFCGVNGFRDGSLPPGARVAGVVEDVDVAGTIRLVRALQPGVRSLSVVLDDTDTSVAIAKRVREEARALGGGLDVRIVSGATMAEVEALVATLGRGDAVLLGSFVRDRAGAFHAYEDVAARVSARSGAPVYGLWEFQLGSGIVGGSLLSGVAQGRRAAEIAVALVEGKVVPVDRGAAPFLAVDERAALRFGLEAGRVPPGATVVNREATLWREHRREAAAAAAVFVLLLGAAALLLASNRRLRRAEAERGRAEAERRRLEHKLQEAQRVEAVGRLAGGIAHDLNNLLTPILAYASLAREQLGPSSPVAEDLGAITSAAQRAREITRRILAFSRRQHLDLRPLDLNEEVATTRELLRTLIGEDVEIRLDLAPDLGRVHGDAAQLQQVLMNLAVNARDAMPAGGRIVVSTRGATPDEAAARPGGRRDGWILLAVEDSGCGIGQDVLPHLFEPFFTTKPFGKGTGLGLSTVHGIVKQHGGDVEVESAPGAGSTFRIWLPVAAPDPPPVAEAPAEPAGRAAAGGTILLVEDEEVVRRLAKRVLAAGGYTVVSAPDGRTALDLAARTPGIALLVTDVVMPGMDGRELHGRLSQSRPGLPVLYVSGYPAMPGTGADIVDGTSAPLLAKPFTPEELLARVRAALDAARQD